MNKLMRSWIIFRKSLHLISSEPKLLIFPMISFLAMLVLIALIFGGFLTAFILSGGGIGVEAAAETDAGGGVDAVQVAHFAFYFLAYLAAMLVSNFCLAAFFSEIFHGLHSESVLVGRGFRFAARRFKAILLWSLLASTVGLLLRAVEERSGLIGRIVLKIIGVAWAVASCFAIPVLVCDESVDNPFVALKKSAAAIRKSWGEALAGFVGLNILTFIAALLWLACVFGLFAVCAATAPAAAMWMGCGVVAAVLTVVFLAFSYLVGVAQHVYQAALYIYATNGDNAIFTEDEIRGAFRTGNQPMR